MAYTLYRNPQDGISIKYPNNWEILENQHGTNVMILMPLDEMKSDFRANLNIVIEDLTDMEISLERYTELSRNQLEKLITDIQIVEPLNPCTLASHSGYELVYRGKQGIFELQWLQTWTVINEKAYVLTYTNTTDDYYDLLEIILEMFYSFQIH